jgi:hypothetical protein
MKQPVILTVAFAATIAAGAHAGLIVNGDFESGNTGFASDYKHSPGGIANEKSYAVADNPHDVHSLAASFGDHTSGEGLMLAVNGATKSNRTVWEQAVVVDPGGEYEFSGWVACSSTASASARSRRRP